MEDSTRAWIGGIIAAAAGGASSVLGSLVIDGVQHVQLGHMLQHAGIVSLISVVLYLKQSPLPKKDDRDDRIDVSKLNLPKE